ncbi:MAG: ABC transporter substrate-binding protein [Hydrogenophaga sp.]
MTGWSERFRAVWVAACLSIGLSGCGEPPRPPLTVGINTWVGYDPLVLARDRGMTDRQIVKVVELISSAEALRHLRNGLLDAAALTLDETLRLADSGFDVRIIALLDTSDGADVVLAAPDVRALADLRGRSIAVEEASVGTLVLERLLKKAGLTSADVSVVKMESTQHLTALQSGRVSVAVSYAPIEGAIRRAGYRRIFDSRQMPGEILDVLVVRGEVLRERPAAVDALLAAWNGGLNVLRLDAVGAAASLGPGADLSTRDYLDVLKGLRFFSPDESLHLLAGSEPGLVGLGQPVAETLMSLGLLSKFPNWAALIDSAPAERAPQAGLLP